jgi:hypothetical protein
MAILGFLLAITLSAFLIFKGRKRFSFGSIRIKEFLKNCLCVFPGLYVIFAIWLSPILPFPAHLAPAEFFAKMYYTPRSYSYWGPRTNFIYPATLRTTNLW